MKNSRILRSFFILLTFSTLLLSLNYNISSIQAGDNSLVFVDPSTEKMALMGEEVVFSVKAINQDDPAAVLTYSASNLPIGATFDADLQIFSWRPLYDFDKKTHALKFSVTDGVNTLDKTIYLSVITLSDKTLLSADEQAYWDNIRNARGLPMTASPVSLPAISDKTFLYQSAGDANYMITEKSLIDGNKSLFLNNLATLQQFQITDGLSNPGNAAVVKNAIVYDDNSPNGRRTYELSFSSSPVIENVSLEGSELVITGEYFGDTQDTSYVLFDGLDAVIISWSDTEIRCVPPDPGETVTITVTTENGESNPWGFEAPVAYTLTINISPAAGGTVTKDDPAKETYNSGDKVILTAAANTGYVFSSWSDGASGNDNPVTVTMYSNKTVQANFNHITHTITASAGENGVILTTDYRGNSINVNEAIDIDVNEGEYKTFDIITTTPYYVIEDVVVDGVSQGAISSYTFPNVTADHTISASFVRPTYTLTININPANGGTVSPDQTTYLAGATPKLTANANPGYSFSSWSGEEELEGSHINPANITMNGNKTITANFTQNEYTLTLNINPANTGSVAKNPNKATYHYGDVVQLTATPNAGYAFSSWTGGLTGTTNPGTITIDGNETVTANFAQNNFTLTVSAVPAEGGSFSINPNLATYPSGTQVTLTALASTGYTFSGWSGDAQGTTSSITVTMDKNKTIQANYTQNAYTLTVNPIPAAGGSITKNPAQSTYTHGQEVILTAAPNANYAFLNWSGDTGGSNTSVTVIMNGNKTVNANFAALYDLTVTLAPTAGGYIIKSPDKPRYTSGESVTITAYTNTGYEFSGWTGSASSTNSSVTITMDSNKALTANFAQMYTLTRQTFGSGSINVNPNNTYYSSGTSVSVTAVPLSGYVLAYWSGDLTGRQNPTSITMNNNKSITATFAPSTYTINASAATNGTISPSGTVTVNYGASQTFNITPNTGYGVQDVLVDGTSVGAVSSYIFNNVTGNHTISATFKLRPQLTSPAAGTVINTTSVRFEWAPVPNANNGITKYFLYVGTSQGSLDIFAQDFSTNTYADVPNIPLNGNPIYVKLAWSTAPGPIYPVETVNYRFDTQLVTYTITSSAGTGGTISPNGSVSVNYGARQDFYIAANSGYRLSDVVVDGTSIGAIAIPTFNLTHTLHNVKSNHTIQASFTRTYTISASAGTGGTITPSGSVSVDSGAGQTFSITPNTGYRIQNVLVDGSSVGAVSTYPFTNVTAHHTIYASFVKTCTITASAGTGGTITPSGIITVDYGTSKTFTITPNTGYRIQDVLVNGTSVGATSTVTYNYVTADSTIQASFALKTYTITASAGTGGSISPSGSVSVNHGTNKTFSITPNTGYRIVDVLVDGSSVGAVSSYTFSNVTAGHTISTSFATNTYTITASAGTGGTISPSGSVSVNYGAGQTFSIAANAGYLIQNVLVDGASVGAVSSYPFTAVSANHTIAVSFAPASKPTAPSGLTAARLSNTSISLSWTDNSNNEAGFKIIRGPRDFSQPFVVAATLEAGVTTYTDTGLTPETPYAYLVYAYNTLGNSEYSNYAFASTSTTPIPAVPSNLAGSALSKTSIKLTWKDNSSNETGFVIIRGLADFSQPFVTVAKLGANVKTYTDTGLTKDTKYAYLIYAYNNGGNSEYSNYAYAKTKK